MGRRTNEVTVKFLLKCASPRVKCSYFVYAVTDGDLRKNFLLTIYLYYYVIISSQLTLVSCARVHDLSNHLTQWIDDPSAPIWGRGGVSGST